jgi:hypothetical protein
VRNEHSVFQNEISTLRIHSGHFLKLNCHGNIKRLRWENMGIFVKSEYNTFRNVNWKILRLSNALLQFTEKGGDDCFDVIHGFVDKLS